MQFIHGCLLCTWTPLKTVFDDRNHFSIKLFSVSMHHQINNSSVPTIQSTWDTDIFGALFFLITLLLLLVFLSAIRLFISSEISFSGNFSLRNSSITRPLILYSVWFFHLSKRKKNPKPKTQPPESKQNQTYKTSNTIKQSNKKKYLETKLLFKFKLWIILWRLDRNTGSACYCRIICKDSPAEQKLHRIAKRLPHLSRIRKEK